MNLKIFRRSISVLIVVLLVLMVFLRGPESQLLMIAAFSVWAIYTLVCVVKSLIKKGNHELTSLLLKTSISEQKSVEEIATALTVENRNLKLILARQVIFRISENLNSCYPDAKWNWGEKNPIDKIMESEPCRIEISNVKTFNFAIINFGLKGELDFSFGKTIPIEEIKKRKKDREIESSLREENEWFYKTGNKILSDLICELNTSGYARFFIDRDGEIIVDEGDSLKTIKTEFSLPDISLIELKSLLKTVKIKSELSEDMLAVMV